MFFKDLRDFEKAVLKAPNPQPQSIFFHCKNVIYVYNGIN